VWVGVGVGVYIYMYTKSIDGSIRWSCFVCVCVGKRGFFRRKILSVRRRAASTIDAVHARRAKG